MKKGSEIVLGQKYRDNLHGIVGIATSVTEYLTGCDRVCLETCKDGEIKSHYFDITQIQNLNLPEEKKKSGGPNDVPPAKNW